MRPAGGINGRQGGGARARLRPPAMPGRAGATPRPPLEAAAGRDPARPPAICAGQARPACMGGTYGMRVSCRNCRLDIVVPIDKGGVLDQVDWAKKPCVNCGTCRLDPASNRPCVPSRDAGRGDGGPGAAAFERLGIGSGGAFKPASAAGSGCRPAATASRMPVPRISCNLRVVACTGTPEEYPHACIAGRGPVCRSTTRRLHHARRRCRPPAPGRGQRSREGCQDRQVRPRSRVRRPVPEDVGGTGTHSSGTPGRPARARRLPPHR